MLTRKQHDLLIFIHDKLEKTGVSPSFEEMKEALGLKSKSGVHRLINALEERGFIRRLPNRARALEVLRLPEMAIAKGRAALRAVPDIASDNVVRGVFGSSKTQDQGKIPLSTGAVDIPFHGKIAAGMPIEALETDRTLSVPPTFLGQGEHFALEISGDSMVDAGIFDGDYAIVRKADTAQDGDIVVALVDQQEATLKTLRRRDGQIQLEPANTQHTAQIYDPRRVLIQGRLVGLMRRY